MKTFTENESFTVKGEEFKFAQVSRKNGGETHVFAMRVATNKLTQVAVSDIDATEKNENPRYTVFKNHFGTQPNYEFMAFISTMVTLFTGCKSALDAGRRIQDHDAFDTFIKLNAHKHSLGI